MAGKIHLPHKNVVEKWKEERVIKWLKRMHLDDCIPAFEARHIDGNKLLELTEQKLFTYQDLKIKHRKQISKCVQECKSQASNAKRIARTLKQKQQQSESGSLDTNGAYGSDEDSDDWGSDFEDESDDEERSDCQTFELNNNCIIHPVTDKPEQKSNINTNLEKVLQQKFIPKPPDVPVIPSIVNGQVLRKASGHPNTIPRPPVKRPPSQPPPPPVAQVPSPEFEQEDYEIPIVSTTPSIEISDASLQSVISNEDGETYEVIQPPEETYEMVDAPSSSNIVEKPLLPPRIPLASGASSPPPPLPQKPKKLKDNVLVHEKPEGVKTFTRPKLKTEIETESSVQPSLISNISFIGTLMGRRSSNTPPPSSSSPKAPHKVSNDGTLSSSHSVVSSSDGLSSRSSSPDKDGAATSDVKKMCPLPPLPPRSAVSEETAQNMASRPLPPVPIVKEEKPTTTHKEDMLRYPWYHEIERQKAEEIVKSLNESGSFVVRPSKRAGIENPFSLTIFHDEKVFHLNIRHRPDYTFALGKDKKKEKTFLNVADLIAFHQTEPILLTSRGEAAGKAILSKYPEKT